MVGDLALRARRPWTSAAADRLARWSQSLRQRPTAPLLALDWSGATETLLIGREEGCDVMLDDPSASRRHARLTFRDGTWVLRDLGSTNGTTLNGEPVGRSRLRPGDVIAFAGRRFRVD